MGFTEMRMASEWIDISIMAEPHRVFWGLQEATVSARKLACMLGVARTTVKKWWRYCVKVSDTKLAILTLFLANWLDDFEREKRSPMGRGGSAMELRLEAPRCDLRLQEACNATLQPGALSKGADKFHAWWYACSHRRDDATSPWDLAPALVK